MRTRILLNLHRLYSGRVTVNVTVVSSIPTRSFLSFDFLALTTRQSAAFSTAAQQRMLHQAETSAYSAICGSSFTQYSAYSQGGPGVKIFHIFRQIFVTCCAWVAKHNTHASPCCQTDKMKTLNNYFPQEGTQNSRTLVPLRHDGLEYWYSSIRLCIDNKKDDLWQANRQLPPARRQGRQS